MKIDIPDIKAQWASVNSINLRFNQVQDELNAKVFYRNNPEGEPNAMGNDLDMAGYNIFNVGTIDGESVVVNWGAIEGSIGDQTDLWDIILDHDGRITENAANLPDDYAGDIADRDAADAALQVGIDEVDADLQNAKAGIQTNAQNITNNTTALNLRMLDTLGTANNTANSLEVVGDQLQLTAGVGTSNTNTLVKTDSSGKVPIELIPVSTGISMKGEFETVAPLTTADNPTVRGLGPFLNGDLYVVGFPSPEVDGEVLVVIDSALGTEAAVLHDAGDAIVYLTLVDSGSADGWYQLDEALSSGSASDTSYSQGANTYVLGVDVQSALDATDTALIARQVDIDSRLPIDGSQSMTGQLGIVDASPAVNLYSDFVGDGTRWQIYVSASDGAVRLRCYEADGAAVKFDHTFRPDGIVTFAGNVTSPAPLDASHITRRDWVQANNLTARTDIDLDAFVTNGYSTASAFTGIPAGFNALGAVIVTRVPSKVATVQLYMDRDGKVATRYTADEGVTWTAWRELASQSWVQANNLTQRTSITDLNLFVDGGYRANNLFTNIPAGFPANGTVLVTSEGSSEVNQTYSAGGRIAFRYSGDAGTGWSGWTELASQSWVQSNTLAGITGSDLDTIVTQGYQLRFGYTNQPTGFNQTGALLVNTSDSITVIQTYTDNANRVANRTTIDAGVTWTAWIELKSQQDFLLTGDRLDIYNVRTS